MDYFDLQALVNHPTIRRLASTAFVATALPIRGQLAKLATQEAEIGAAEARAAYESATVLSSILSRLGVPYGGGGGSMNPIDAEAERTNLLELLFSSPAWKLDYAETKQAVADGTIGGVLEGAIGQLLISLTGLEVSAPAVAESIVIRK